MLFIYVSIKLTGRTGTFEDETHQDDVRPHFLFYNCERIVSEPAKIFA